MDKTCYSVITVSDLDFGGIGVYNYYTVVKGIHAISSISSHVQHRKVFIYDVLAITVAGKIAVGAPALGA
jgi:hypothetical protein